MLAVFKSAGTQPVSFLDGRFRGHDGAHV